MKKIRIWTLVFCLLLPIFSFSSVHAAASTYDVLQFSKKIKSFSTLNEAKTFSYTLEFTSVVEQPSNTVVYSNLPVGFGVYQNNQLISNFSDLNSAIAKADTLDYSYVIDGETYLWAWDNIPNYDVLDASGKKLVSKGFKYLPDAYNFTQSQSGSQLKSLNSSEILWKNAAPAAASSNVTVSASLLNVRSGPSTEYAITTSLVKGDNLKLLTTGGTWNKVMLPDNSTGFVYSSYISPGSSTSPAAPNGKTVILDAGHGGADPGALGIGSYQEKVVTLNFTLATKTALEAQGYKVVLTRGTDTSCNVPYTTSSADLICRVNLVKNYTSPNSIFISIHANWAYATSARGTETYYNANSDYDGRMNAYPAKSKLLSDTVQKHIVPAFGSLNRSSKDSSYYVLRYNTVPAILIELGFLSNEDDLAKMKSTSVQSSVAKAIVTGVNEYFSK